MHRKLTYIFAAFLITSCLIGLGFLPNTTAHAASFNYAQEASTISHDAPSWVVQAEPYIHFSHGIAIIDTSIQQHLTISEIKQVKAAVAKYNSLSLQEKQSQTVSIPTSKAIPQAVCRKVVTKNVEWWGIAFYLNDCAVQTFLFYEGEAAAIAAVISSVCAPCAPIAGVMAAIIGADAANLAHLDSQCGGSGAYINETWVGVWWDSSTC